MDRISECTREKMLELEIEGFRREDILEEMFKIIAYYCYQGSIELRSLEFLAPNGRYTLKLEKMEE